MTLVNTPTFNSAGYFTFNGSTTRATVTGVGASYASFTINMFVKPTSNPGPYNAFMSATQGVLNDYLEGITWDLGTYSSTSFKVMNLEISRNHGGFYDRDVMASDIAFSIWTGISLVVDTVSNTFTVYINGVQDYSAAYAGTITYFDMINIGARYYGGAHRGFFTGDIATAMLYNRALEVGEVKQNFNALRGRFGL